MTISLNVVADTMTCPFVMLSEPQSIAEGESGHIVTTDKYLTLTCTSRWLKCPLSNRSILFTSSGVCSSESVTIVTDVGCNTTNIVSGDNHLSIVRSHQCIELWTHDNCV